jgi:hypothetical protein
VIGVTRQLDFAAAADALYGAPFAGFVAERKRLADELKAAGDADGARRLAAINRPPLSAWAVNQLWRKARKQVEALFAAAREVQGGDLGAAALHRDVLADLRGKAAEVLTADGNAAAEPTLRRITQTLQGLAASGGFEPDAPGQLTADRDPPGFEALAGLVGAAVPRPPPRVAPKQEKPKPAPREPGQTAADRAAARAEEKRRQAEAEAAARARATRRRELELAARTAERSFEGAGRELEHAKVALASAQERVATAEAALTEARAKAEAAHGELEAFDAAEG